MAINQYMPNSNGMNYGGQPFYYQPTAPQPLISPQPVYNNNSNYYSNFNSNQPQQSQQIGYLLGKVVDGEEILKVTEVPIGGYGIFPKADFSEIYVKYWTNNGTTNIMKFAPITKQEEDQPKITLQNIMDQLTELNGKINNFCNVENQQQQKIKEVRNEF